MENNEIIELIQETINKIKPFIQRDGGDILFDKFEDGFVYVTMLGACQDCAFVDDTISGGVEIILMEEVPGVLGVKITEQ